MHIFFFYISKDFKRIIVDFLHTGIYYYMVTLIHKIAVLHLAVVEKYVINIATKCL